MKTFNQIREGIEQLIAWFPVIWNTHDFDEYYLLEITRFKMKRMYKFFTSKYAMGEHNEDDLLALKRCINILDLLKDEKYDENAFDAHYAKFPMPSLEEMFNYSQPMGDDECKSFRKAMVQAEKDHEKLITEFCKLFSEYYRNWWD